METLQKSQASLEYVILVGILLVMLIPLIYFSFEKTSENVKLTLAEDVVKSLAKAADDVYALSPGTKKQVIVTVPSGVKGSLINSSEISLTLSIFGQTTDIMSVTKATVIGYIPVEKGTYRIPVELLDSGVVQIGEGSDSIPPIITWKYPEGAACNPITLRVNTNEPARCRFDTSDKEYADMQKEMEGNSLGHSYSFGVQNENSYKYYTRCQDSFGNVMGNSEIIEYYINYTACGEGSSEGEIYNETTPPVVTLINPASDYTTNTSRNYFTYSVSDQSSITFCNLIANAEIINTVIMPAKDIPNNIAGDLDLGTYNWSVSCADAFGNVGNSSSRIIIINAVLDDDMPIVNAISPLNGSIRNFNLIKFFYNVTDATSGISFCTLSFVGILDLGSVSMQSISDYSIVENEQQIISTTLERGNYTWNISCTDSSIYQNKGYSKNRWLRVNTTAEELFITSCAGLCGFEGYSGGLCRQEAPKCQQNGEVYFPAGDIYCIESGAQADACCCRP